MTTFFEFAGYAIVPIVSLLTIFKLLIELIVLIAKSKKTTEPLASDTSGQFSPSEQVAIDEEISASSIIIPNREQIAYFNQQHLVWRGENANSDALNSMLIRSGDQRASANRAQVNLVRSRLQFWIAVFLIAS